VQYEVRAACVRAPLAERAGVEALGLQSTVQYSDINAYFLLLPPQVQEVDVAAQVVLSTSSAIKK